MAYLRYTKTQLIMIWIMRNVANVLFSITRTSTMRTDVRQETEALLTPTHSTAVSVTSDLIPISIMTWTPKKWSLWWTIVCVQSYIWWLVLMYCYVLVSKQDHSQNDYFVCCILTHGEADHLWAKDGKYLTDMILSFFTGDKCKSLAGKPKIFIIQVWICFCYLHHFNDKYLQTIERIETSI